MSKQSIKNAQALTHAERGSLGGKTTAQRHGAMHMEAIGRAGFWATVEKYFGGDVAASPICRCSGRTAQRASPAPR